MPQRLYHFNIAAGKSEADLKYFMYFKYLKIVRFVIKCMRLQSFVKGHLVWV